MPERPAASGAASALAGPRSAPAAVWALVGLQLVLLLSYAVVVPTYRAPDEPQHLDMVFALREGSSWPAPDNPRRMTAQIIESYDHARFDFAERRAEAPLLRADAPAREARPAFAEVAPDALVGVENWMFQHPPGYYGAAAAWLTAVTAMVPGAQEWPFDAVVLVVRLLSVLCIAPLPLLAYLAARRIGLAESAALAAASLPPAVPTLAHIGSAVNNDNLLTLAIGIVTVLLAGVCRGDVRERTAVALGGLSAVALLTKGFALALPAIVASAYLLAARRRSWQTIVRPLAVIAGLAALGGWWWLRNLVSYGTLQPRGSPLLDPPAGFEAQPLEWMATAARWLPQRFWGSFGWYQAFLPDVVWISATALVLTGVVVALTVRPGRRARGPGRSDLAVLLVPTAGILAIVLYGAWSYYAGSGYLAALQGRYLYPGLVGLAVVCAAGWRRLAGRFAPLLPLLVLTGAGVLQVCGLAVVLRRFYGAEGAGLAERLAALAAWAPVPTPVLWLLGVGLVGAGVAAAGLLTSAAASMWHRGGMSPLESRAS